MGPFRFRAQPALDLRKREDDAARRAVAEAELEVRHAAAVVSEQVDALESAHSAHNTHYRHDTAGHEAEWYRSWIAGLEQTLRDARVVLATREEVLAARRCARAVTRQKVDALERFKEKARRAYDLAVLAEEQRLTDAAGTARFVAQRRSFLESATEDYS